LLCRCWFAPRLIKKVVTLVDELPVLRCDMVPGLHGRHLLLGSTHARGNPVSGKKLVPLVNIGYEITFFK
jgi:hypothetical protein